MQPGSDIRVTTLPGGVSCDVWRVEAAGRTICVKRALQRLRVAKFWEAPITRSEAEWNWLNFAASVAPGAVPQTLAHDPAAGMIALEYLDPEQYPVWKPMLFDGAVQPRGAFLAQTGCNGAWMNVRFEQRFVGIDVAHPAQEFLVEQQRFDS